MHVEAGLNLQLLEDALQRKGLTLGHHPSSITCSTIGGALAARGAGQLSTRYGKAEDMVVGVEVVLPSGQRVETLVTPRAATGPDWNQLFVGSEGTLGVIVNRLTDVSLSEVLPDLEGGGKEMHRMFFGGPVALNGLLFVFRSARPPEGASHVMGDVYFSAELEVLEKALKRKTSSSALRLFLGHSGWGPGQLKWELGRGDWELVRADTETVFEKDPDSIWPELMGPVTRRVAE